METGSVFDFTGSAKMMRLKITLAQKSLSETLNTTGNPDESMVSRAIDELNLQWQQKVSPPNENPNAQDSSRREARLFTYIDGDELPERLRLPSAAQSSDEGSATSAYDKWAAHNAVVDLPLRRNHKAIRCERRVMYVMAYLGSLTSPYNNRDEYVVCRITLLNDRSMIFEPRLSHNGYSIHSKMGEYLALVQIWDDYFTPMYSQYEAMAPPIPEAQSFELPEEDTTQFVSLVNIDYATNFDYKTIWIEYMAYFPEGTVCTSNNTQGQTAQCTMDELAQDGDWERVRFYWISEDDETKNGQFNFCTPIELDFTAPKISSFSLRFRVRSEDFLGRQYIAGYASLNPLLAPGSYIRSAQFRTDYRIEFWRPIKAGDHTSQLREFYIGQAIDIDFFNWKEDGVISRAGLTTQSSGTLHISVTNIVQRRDYMARETLNNMKYGAMFGRMGMKSDLYWRIMKVLMEFEEAKRQLLNVRASR
ncbi:hypothetical protein OESDEN_10603 [Oesophagostomum dentatum]|uniref:Uncharacterized protein n=1 Tax=Oesophagostomum dentatum TaxID=61180 RepID=A0A0B1SW92_OESDE|nr:hypothetical protein OESDEN_10603 [Oesophagostomum dentatum]